MRTAAKYSSRQAFVEGVRNFKAEKAPLAELAGRLFFTCAKKCRKRGTVIQSRRIKVLEGALSVDTRDDDGFCDAVTAPTNTNLRDINWSDREC